MSELPTVILDIDDTATNSRKIDFMIFNRATGKNLNPADYPTVFSMLKIFGVSREFASMVRRQALEYPIEWEYIPGFLPAIKALEGLVRFDMFTAREDFSINYTREFIAETPLPRDTEVFFCACPKDGCDTAECLVRPKKYELALERGAIALLDDHPGEFTRHSECPTGISLACLRKTYNADIPPFFPRLGWPGFVNHVRQLLASS
jgi:hypothetical protein